MSFDGDTPDPFANGGMMDPASYSKHDGGCYNCGQAGHNKTECPNPRIDRPFTGSCNICGVEGHRAAECSQAPARTCRACGQEGHGSSTCTNARLIYDESTPQMSVTEAWDALVAADTAKEINMFRDALNAYTRCMPNLTFADLEKELRAAGMNIHIIAKEQSISDTMTIVNLQGKKDCKYVVSFQYSYKPSRPRFAAGWPLSAEDNFVRLMDAGYVKDSLIPKCRNCDEMGHVSKNCPNERKERAKLEPVCGNCKETGHWLRDCTAPRQDTNICRNCKQPGHRASECTEPRDMSTMECKNCHEMGHPAKECPTREVRLCRNCGEEGHKAMDCEKERVLKCYNCEQEGHSARDCPEPPNPANMKCRNCDEKGHSSRECPKPRDYSRVQCMVCQEYGHTRVRCPKNDSVSGGDVFTPTVPIISNKPFSAPTNGDSSANDGSIATNVKVQSMDKDMSMNDWEKTTNDLESAEHVVSVGNVGASADNSIW